MNSAEAVPPHEPAVDSVAAVEQLISRWQRASRLAGWSADEPWWLAEVEAVARLLADPAPSGDRLAPACADLGTARATAGFDLTESRTDLKAGLQVVGADPASSLMALEAVDALTLGWIEAALSSAAGSGSVDPLTRLASRDYLLGRLDELYAAAAKSGGTPSESHELLVVRLRTAPAPLVREMRMVLLERALRSVLDGGQTIARWAPNLIVALVERAAEPHGDRSDPSSRLRAAFEEWLTPEQLADTSVDRRALPEGAADLPSTLRHLGDRH